MGSADEGRPGVDVRGGLLAAVVSEYLQACGGVPVTAVKMPTGPNQGKLIYVAGPMRNIDLFNFPAFYAAEKRLESDGWEVLNPARHDNEGGFDETQNSLVGFDMRAAFRWDVESIFQSDAIYLLRGWERSTGATAELSVAKMLGLEVMYEAESASILVTAEQLTTRDRQHVYGHPHPDFTRAADMWSAIIGAEITPHQFALCMIAVKMSRLLQSPSHRDSIVDIAGYANCYAMVVEEEARLAAEG